MTALDRFERHLASGEHHVTGSRRRHVTGSRRHHVETYLVVGRW